MKLQIKYMVSDRCKLLVRTELQKLGLNIINIRLGEIEIAENLTEDSRLHLTTALTGSGLELIEDRRSEITEKVKIAINEMIRNKEKIQKGRISHYLSNLLNCNYIYISNVFSSNEGITIREYLLNQRIEYVKILIVKNELSITEIAYSLNFSSVAHLSAQFKKVTGSTPTFYKVSTFADEYTLLNNYVIQNKE
ncbi:MAG: AraC family transcriptional regulator [Chitinophagales bacterium]|jgi:AraC-like DNA-binding protein|nr:AraC family transcriptional regulator [Bacteroidota bacterium]MBK7569362.1 AraC family transcriptional regulator [Bacteroidota bacterium]MBP8915268.1 AraC family transcriptional regulator [Chitinophagales bacterium]MBP9219907.1 AraC family transcriptional regulator [Chitinophagales bacterium]MBP9795077.1 AraC family transcriptional regulator [Chitinophagales bacterium]